MKTLYTGDLDPALQITLRDEAGGVLDATDPSVGIRIIGKRLGVPVFEHEPTSRTLVGENTLLVMEWEEGDTAEPGRIKIEVEVTWPDLEIPGGRPQTFVGDKPIQILKDADYVG